MIDVVCFKTGDKYGPEYVNRLGAMVDRWLSVPHEFLCYTDSSDGLHVPSLPLPDPCFLEWWSKISFFRPRLTRTILLDLDTIILGSCNFLAEYTGPFCVLHDFYRPGHAFGSAIMSLQAGDYGAHVFEHFRWPPPTSLHGDQNFLELEFPHADFWQDIAPGAICSYKVHVQHRGTVPPGASVVCFHGHPKPHNLPKHHFLRQVWESYA